MDLIRNKECLHDLSKVIKLEDIERKNSLHDIFYECALAAKKCHFYILEHYYYILSENIGFISKPFTCITQWMHIEEWIRNCDDVSYKNEMIPYLPRIERDFLDTYQFLKAYDISSAIDVIVGFRDDITDKDNFIIKYNRFPNDFDDFEGI